MTLLPNNEPCLCGSGLNYADCCSPFHSGDAYPATAEALMRSRFTAYVKRNAEYLLASWDASKRPVAIDFSKEKAEWQKLLIVGTQKGGKHDSKGIVEFKAFYHQEGEHYFMHEISRFIKTGQRWLYVDGVIKAVSKAGSNSDTGRNALCSCGSGKKFKRCCGANV